MPNCIVKGCPHRSGKKDLFPDVILHVFPSSLERIKEWLLQTGQPFNNIELLANHILESKKTDNYRMCSTHFKSECYVTNRDTRSLKSDAVPTIFPPLTEGRIIIDEKITTRAYKRVKSDESSLSSTSRESSSTSQTVLVERSTNTDILHVDAETQTDIASVVNEAFLRSISQTMSYDEFIKFMSKQTFLHTFTAPVMSVSQLPPRKEYPADFSIEESDHTYFLKHSTPVSSASELPQREDDLVELLKEKSDHTYFLRHSTPVMSVSQPPIDEFASGNFPTQKFIQKEDDDISGIFPMKDTDSLQSVQLSVSLEESIEILEKTDPKDPDYIQEMPSLNESDNCFDEEEMRDEDKDMVTERKFIIFESCLDSLLYKVKCHGQKGCSNELVQLEKYVEGTYVSVKATCAKGHTFKVFESQPRLRRHAAGNVLLAASVLFSGSNFQKVQEFLNIYGVCQISEKSYYRYQNRFCFPVIDLAWKNDQDNVKSQLEGKPLCFIGDGQCDSPGHSAKYCVYTMMDIVSDKIVDFEVVQKTQTGSSGGMEKFGFEKCMERAKSAGLDICIFASDRHPSICKIFRDIKEFKHIDHQYDIWHYAKSLHKKLLAASRKRHCKAIIPWIEKIIHHFWWCVKTCNKDVVLLKEKWLSVVFHITNQHEWESGEVYKKCQHGPISSHEESQSLWLQKGTPAYYQIEEIVHNDKLICDLTRLKRNCHTGAVEVYHSNVLKYRPKRIHFGIDGMEARTKLAALAHNNNVGRKQAVVHVSRKNTAAEGTGRTKMVFPKGKKRWVVRVVYEAMCNDHLEGMMTDVIKMCKGELQSSWFSKAKLFPQNIACIERPNKEEAVAQHKSRFGIIYHEGEDSDVDIDGDSDQEQ